MKGAEFTERLEKLASRGPAPVAITLMALFLWKAVEPLPLAAWLALELTLQTTIIPRISLRWPQHYQWLHLLRLCLSTASLLLLPFWASPSTPVWLWAATSLPPQFVLFSRRKAFVFGSVIISSALFGHWLHGAGIDELAVPGMVLLMLVLGLAPYTYPLRRLVIQARADAVDLRNFRRVIEQAGEGLAIAGADSRLQFVNPAWEKITGIDAEDAVGRTPKELLRSPHVDPALFTEIEEAIKRGETWQGDLESRTSAGKRIEVHLTVSGVMMDGQVTHFVEVRSDVKERNRIIAELRAARQAAEDANRAKSGFLANVSHEIRTPMNGVVGMASLLEESDLDPEQQEQVRIIRGSAESLIAIIQKVLDFASIEAGRLDLFRSAFELRPLCKSVLAMIRALPDARQLDVKLDIDETVPRWVEGDATRLRQVLTNLMANGAKFTRAGSVTLRLRATGGDSVELAVIDTGRGIAEEALSNVFKPFFQVGGGAERPRGTGLGLAICNQIVHAMGTQLHVESELGRGTTFRFELSLPRAQPPHYEQPADAERASEDKEQSRSILVAEDDRITQRMMTLIFKRLGHRAHVVNNGREALSALEEGTYDLVFMDCQMPVMDGLEATRRIRAAEGGDAHVVLGLSADVRPEHIETCKVAGMNAIFSKPISLEEMRTILARWLSAEERAGGVDEA